ncbi:hypothetical protein SODALDRAFT_53022 [Sodiomyces alkalinus F11]|uniref:RRM domain-containing protein n=1 Tax=Sodiomyces alkalinus (strain CBS 110278 / VKM F-3762 / F11) TaxID=1314773 RepID=A0A3N2PN08_SODAK|nr:hypothetical protein SODALDRAFT_53022 [Sodiomyces alkalinus F11]ROT35869.1 hypothetical protein SODALDRAFT_53022 [Sodiomyces alkalinus F11]
MSSRSAKSILRDVEPGCKTGLYYITIANLPFMTNWREIKDWLQCCCAVEHVEIFNSSTSGWVRVKGEENFLRAWALLNQGEFGGRSIIADGRNATERIKIKDLVDATQKPAPQFQTTSALNSPSYSGRWSAGTEPAPAVGSPFVQPPAFGYGATPPAFYSPTEAAAAHPTAATSRYQYENLDTRAQVDYGHGAYSPSSQYNVQGHAESEMPGPYDHSDQWSAADQRRILITHLGHNTSEDQVRKMVKSSARKLTTDKSQLQHIDFPRARDGRLRGHVYVTFKSRDMAEKVADDLNGRPFQRQHLEARLIGDSAREPPYDFPPQKKAKEEKSLDKRKDRCSKRGKEKKEVTKSRGRDNEGLQQSTYELFDKLALDDRDWAEGHGRQRIQPVIADGSSRWSRSPDSQRFGGSGSDF